MSRGASPPSLKARMLYNSIYRKTVPYSNYHMHIVNQRSVPCANHMTEMEIWQLGARLHGSTVMLHTPKCMILCNANSREITLSLMLYTTVQVASCNPEMIFHAGGGEATKIPPGLLNVVWRS